MFGPQKPIKADSRRHSWYYFPDGNLIFEVEGILYNVYRYFFQRESPVLNSMICSRPGVLGHTEDRPLLLEGITVIDFDRFLGVLYPVMCNFCNRPATTSVDDWASIFQVATKLNFQSIKDLAVRQLVSITSPVDRIILGRKFEISEWLPAAYKCICSRAEALTLEEGVQLGMEDVIKISAVRQGRRDPEISDKIDFEMIFGFRAPNSFEYQEEMGVAFDEENFSLYQ